MKTLPLFLLLGSLAWGQQTPRMTQPEHWHTGKWAEECMGCAINFSQGNQVERRGYLSVVNDEQIELLHCDFTVDEKRPASGCKLENGATLDDAMTAVARGWERFQSGALGIIESDGGGAENKNGGGAFQPKRRNSLVYDLKPDPIDVPAITVTVEEEYGNNDWCNTCSNFACTAMACDPHVKHKVTHTTCDPKTLVLQHDEQEPPKWWCHKVQPESSQKENQP